MDGSTLTLRGEVLSSALFGQAKGVTPALLQPSTPNRKIQHIMRIVHLFFLLLAALPMAAQRQNVSGSVKGPDGGIPKVSIRELDHNKRICNHTTADQNGLFSFEVRDAQHSLQFYAPGYRTMVHKMLGEKRFTVTMEPRRTSPYVASAKVIMKSDKLFCGHYLMETVKQQAWIEKMCDTLYTIILPVAMERPVDEYPAGRQLIVLDEMGHQSMVCENVVDAYPISGDPDEVNQTRLAQSYTGVGYVPGRFDGEENLYAYPHFQFSRAQLESICQDPSRMARLAVDTQKADNYWNIFPTDQTISLIKKALAKK